MAMGNLFDDDEEQTDEEPVQADEEQKKSLVANLYNNAGQDDPDPYKQLDWEMPDRGEELTLEEAMLVSYQFIAPRSDGSAIVQSTLNDYSEGGHEEWYATLQLKLAHIFGDVGVQIPEFERRDIEPQGAPPMLEFLGIDADDIIDYLSQNPEMASDVYQRLQQAAEDDDSEEEEAESDESEETEQEPAEADD